MYIHIYICLYMYTIIKAILIIRVRRNPGDQASRL